MIAWFNFTSQVLPSPLSPLSSTQIPPLMGMSWPLTMASVLQMLTNDMTPILYYRLLTAAVDSLQLLAPQKVHIPERYVPDSSDEELELSPEEKQRRAEKAEQIRKLVASQR